MASRIDKLVAAYERFVALPWKEGLSGIERTWFLVYPPADERRLRARLDAFAIATGKAGHRWALCDLTGAFAQWLASLPYREAYFEDPDALDMALPQFHDAVVGRIRTALEQATGDTVVAVLGVATLFGFLRASRVLEDPRVTRAIRGRLLVFFPGEHARNNYRLLGARDGWSYMAVPIEPDDSGASTR